MLTGRNSCSRVSSRSLFYEHESVPYSCKIPRQHRKHTHTQQTHTLKWQRSKRNAYTTYFKWDVDRRYEELLTYVYQPQSLKDSLPKFFALQLYCNGLQQKQSADKTHTRTFQSLGGNAGLAEGLRSATHGSGCEESICLCSSTSGHICFFVCVYACMKALVCVCLDMLNSICIFLAGRKTDSQGSRTGGGGGAAHTCSAQIRLICLGLASHCLPLSTLELPVSLPRVFPSWGGWVRFKMHTEYRTICFFSF